MKLKRTQNLAEVIELEHANPVERREICYQDQTHTIWQRLPLSRSRKGEYVTYSCESYGSTKAYPLLREVEK